MSKKKGSWIVRVEVTGDRELVCDNCTEEQARDDPYNHVVSEKDYGVTDYRVISVNPND